PARRALLPLPYYCPALPVSFGSLPAARLRSRGAGWLLSCRATPPGLVPFAIDQPVPGLAQVELHGHARPFAVLFADGAEDGRMLVGHPLGPLARARARQAQRQPHEAADRFVDGFEHAQVIVVAGGLRDAGMKGQVRLGRNMAVLERLDERRVRVGDLAQFVVGAPQRRQARRIALERDPDFLCAQIRAYVLHVAEGLQARRGLVADERAEALVGRDQAVGAQPQQR